MLYFSWLYSLHKFAQMDKDDAKCYLLVFMLCIYRYSVREVIEILLEDTDFTSADVYIPPPENATGSLTDEDSADEDDTGNLDNLPGTQLRQTAEVVLHGPAGFDEESATSADDPAMHSTSGGDGEQTNPPELELVTRPARSRQPSRRKQSDAHPTVGDGDQAERSESSATTNKRKQNNTTTTQKFAKKQKLQRKWIKKDICTVQPRTDAYSVNEDLAATPEAMFEKFFDEELYTMIMERSNTYALKHGKTLDVSIGELKCAFAVLLLSGYVNLPRRRMLWESSDDTYNQLAVKAIRRDRFDDIIGSLSVADSDNLDAHDKFTKVRPLFRELNARFLKHAPSEEIHSIDESMVPYFGKHGAKQCIRGKPIRFGYKIWCGCSDWDTAFGWILMSEKGSVTKYDELGLGASVILQYADVLATKEKRRYHFFFDNFFTSLTLVEELTSRNISCTGTVRENRTDNCPVTASKDMVKMARGSYDYRTDQDTCVLVCRWKDNSIVTVVSNTTGVHPLCKASIYSFAEKKRVYIDQPHLIRSYCENMGGVDRLDQNLAAYRISIRKKKWYFPLLMHCIDVAVQNAWQLYRRTESENRDLLSFRRYIVLSYARKYGTAPQPGRRGRPTESGFSTDIRLDGLCHYITQQDKQTRCRHCHQKTTTRCTKCDVGVHVRCFVDFHTRP